MNVTSLLKTVKAVEDEHTRGTRAMEATVDAISQELRSMQYAPEMMRSSMQQLSKPEDLITVTKHVTAATAKAVAAGTSNLQSDIAAAANLGRKTISDMLIVCKSVAWSCAETPELRQRTLDAGSAVAIAYRDLLEGILHHCTADERMQLSRRVAMCVTDLVGMAQLLKGSEWVDPEDPTVIAENELLGAAASIEAAAKKLANLRPRRQEVKVSSAQMVSSAIYLSVCIAAVIRHSRPLSGRFFYTYMVKDSSGNGDGVLLCYMLDLDAFGKICLIFLVVKLFNYHPGIKHIITVTIVARRVPLCRKTENG